jgi:hypothetical protein
MGRRFHHQVEGVADVEEVFGVLSSELWASQLQAALNDGSTLIRRVVGTDGAVDLVMSRRTESLPGFVAKFAPDDLMIVTSDSWGALVDGVRECSWTAEIPGTPVRIRGTQRIEPISGGARHLTSGEVVVPVPLVGGRIEKFIVEQIDRIAHEEADLVRTVVESQRA